MTNQKQTLIAIINNLEEVQKTKHFINYWYNPEKLADLNYCFEESFDYDYIMTGAYEYYEENYSEEGYQEYLEDQGQNYEPGLSYEEWLESDYSLRHEEKLEVLDRFTENQFMEISDLIHQLEIELEQLN